MKKKAEAFGFIKKNIFPLWEWVGGRYSIWSAISLPLMLMIGPRQFSEFLAGAYEMDQHFIKTPPHENMPMILALLGIWYYNFFDISAHAIIPYAYRLRKLIPYLQQLDMESNGKTINIRGEPITYRTGPILFGEEGVIGQHAYHQWLHQGYRFTPADFIIVSNTDHTDYRHHQALLIASALSQSQALVKGKTYEEAYSELEKKINQDQAQFLARHQMIAGNKPHNLLFIDKITPKTLGALLALYEHKVFVQGMIWEINSFDQWGVELGKNLLPTIYRPLLHNTESVHPLLHLK